VSEPLPPLPWADLVRLQLSLLDLYESVLDSPGWDEAKVNTLLKAFMSSLLAAIRVQQSVGAQVTSLQREMIGRYRASLEAWLEMHGNAANGAAQRGVGH
jgi:hypothetical protein